MNLYALNRLPFAPAVGVMFAAVAAILVIATPQFLFERAVTGSGLPDFIGAATPPLGEKARVACAMLAAGVTGTLVWLGLSRVERTPLIRKAQSRGGSIGAAAGTSGLQRVHAQPPRPVFAGSDLGAPFMSDEAMMLAKEELLLDPEMIEEKEPIPAPRAPVAAIRRAQSVGGMMRELEDALGRREQRVGRAAPIPGDIASLRAALGMSIAA